MALPYPVQGQYTGSVSSGSYFNEQDNSLFYTTQSTDVWFGVSPRDVVEFGVYNVSDFSLVQWETFYTQKHFNQVTLSFIDDLNIAHNYSYNELKNEFTLYKHDQVLLTPANDLLNSGITNGTYEVSYNFIRQMAGTPDAPLTIKEISPSRTEVKLIPTGEIDVAYESFCIQKFPLRDVAPIVLQIVQKCPYSQIYNVMAPNYQSGINFLKFAFFLTDDGAVLTFLKNIYEDYIKYTFLTEDQLAAGIDPTQISRIQGIRSYFNNYVLENYESITDFQNLSTQFSEFTNIRLDKRFGQFINSAEQGYKDARQFCYDFFFTFFYTAQVAPLERSHADKYFGLMKNVINFGNNSYFPIINQGYIDERPSGSLVLTLKLTTPLPTDVVPKTNCWVSNFGMAPFVFTAVFQNPVVFKTIKISAPNFGSPSGFISRENINTLYSSNDLAQPDPATQDDITVSQTISALNTDYTDYQNFVVFSSAQTRLSLFRKKVVDWSALSASLVELDRRYLASLSGSVAYPYYTTERDRITGEISDIINSFDGYESFLFNSGKYGYSVVSQSFLSASFIEDEDVKAQEYDKTNSDNLLANTPEYLLRDPNSADYLTFLQMIGHHFDNIYTYISGLPIERQLKNEVSASLPTNTLKEMLYSFGWNVDDLVGSLDIDEVFLNSMDSASFDSMSADQRMRTIWNRILITLPGIYKTKGTEECVDFLMACYGLPTSLISIREYGGTDFGDNTTPTYKLDEKFYMLEFSGSTYIQGPIPHTAKTIEFKFATDEIPFKQYQYIPLFRMVPYPYTDVSASTWDVGITKTPGQYMGHVSLRFLSGSTGQIISSSTMPIFNGEIFTVMVRRNEPFVDFQTTVDEDAIPLVYDLVVQRNEDGRRIFYSTSSAILYDQDNMAFSQFGIWTLGSSNYFGNLDKLSIWDKPITDSDFEEHVNDLNSYGYSGSAAFQNLWVRMSVDYPKSLYYNLSGSSVVWVDNQSPYYAIPNYYNDPSNLSSSLNPQLYSASVEIFETRWQPDYASGSIEIRAYNWPRITNDQWSASWNGCNWVSSSAYPFNYIEYTYQQDIDASKYGPNRYKNKKIRDITYNIDARFDPYDRSTSQPDLTTSGESNQLGFFIDPQDSKNKDIIRYVGRDGIMEMIADPANMFSDKYYDLVNKNAEYNDHGNKRTLFNELLTVYKFYFDKSIFQAIKNVLPARANAYTGVVVEPTVLERPKYQNRPISSSVITSIQDPTVLNDLYTFSEQLLWVDFNTNWTQLGSSASLLATLPANYQDVIDVSYINLPTRVMPSNLDPKSCGFVPDSLDHFQLGYYPDFETQPRKWEAVNGAPPTWPTNSIVGSTTHNLPGDVFTIGPDPNYSQVWTTDPVSAGYNTGSHQILYYLVKVWDQYKYFAKSGDYIRTDDPAANPYDSASVYLYKYILVTEPFMRRLIYWYDKTPFIAGNSDPSPTYLGGQYLHSVNTFIGTPDQRFSNVVASNTGSVVKTDYRIGLASGSMYFQLAAGYPRNHYIHKMQQFSTTRYVVWAGGSFTKGRQTVDTTVNQNGINDGTYPVSSFNVSNVNVVNSSNVIQLVPSDHTGQSTPTGLQGGNTGGNTNSTPTSTGGTISSGGGSGVPTGSMSSGGGGGGCLIAGTQIRMGDGTTKNVEDIQVGDILTGYQNTVPVTFVTELKPNRWDEYYVINNRLKITYEHPVMVQNKKWHQQLYSGLIEVKWLEVGDLMVKWDGSTEAITSITTVQGETPTYNFIVAGNHLYIAEDIVVHNPTHEKF